MKLSYSEVKKIQRMTQNELTRYLGDIGVQAYRQGVQDGEKELDNASPGQWIEYINKTPSAHDIFTITDGDTLEAAFRDVLKRRIDSISDRLTARVNKTQRDFMTAILSDTMTSDMLWEALTDADKITRD